MPASYPATADVRGLFTSADIDMPFTDAQLNIAINASILWWDRITGWSPFLAGTASARLFDPPGTDKGLYLASLSGGKRHLNLHAGLISVTALTVSGTARVLNTDFWLKPADARTKSRPYEMIEFAGPVYGSVNAISINGVWGFSTDVPDDVWLAVLYSAGVHALLAQGLKTAQGIEEWAELDVREKYGDKPFMGTINSWKEIATGTAQLYKRYSQFM